MSRTQFPAAVRPIPQRFRDTPTRTGDSACVESYRQILVTAGPVSVQDRTLYATVTAFALASGNDFDLVWTATDTDGNVWPRTASVLCAPTS